MSSEKFIAHVEKKKKTVNALIWSTIMSHIVGILTIICMILAAILLGMIGSAHGQTYVAPQLIPPQKLDAIRRSLPDTENDIWQDVFDSPDTMFYTEAEMPPCYQHNLNGQVMSFHYTKYNISGDNGEMQKGHGNGGNANIEFPWKSPGGTDASGPTSRSSVKFMKLPRAGNGSFWPVVVYNKVSDKGERMLTWSFPVETVFGEILYIQDPYRMLRVFEVRLRIRRPDFWDVEVLRPFPTYDEFRARLAEIAPNEAAKTPKHTPVRPGVLEDVAHPVRGFARTAIVQELPALPPDVVIKLLDEPFKATAGLAWAGTSSGTGYSYAPTARDFSIVPVNYTGTFLGTNHISCKGCHESTTLSADHFDSPRQWYGYIRGSDDGIFSFHPISPGSISYNGGNVFPQLRADLVYYGIVAQYDARIHHSSVYTLIEK